MIQSKVLRNSLMTLATHLGEGVLVSRLRSRQQPQGLQSFISDQSLRKPRNPLHHIDQIEDDPPLRSHHQIEVAQSHVEIYHHDLLPCLRESGAESRGGCRLAHAALA